MSVPELSRRREVEWETRAATLQRQFDSRLAAAQALRDDYLQLGASHAALQQQNTRLEHRIAELEAAVSRLDTRLTDAAERQDEFAWQLDESIRHEIPATVSLEARRWASRKMPHLLAHLLQQQADSSGREERTPEDDGSALSASSIEPSPAP